MCWRVFEGFREGVYWKMFMDVCWKVFEDVCVRRCLRLCVLKSV